MQEQTKQQKQETTEEVIVSKDIGVYFDDRSYQDDLKSRVFRIFKRREKQKKREKSVAAEIN